MKKLFLITVNGPVYMEEDFETLEDIRLKYNLPMHKTWEEEDRFCLEVISTHNERDTMKGRDNNGWCY